jgi:hypothetical protein
LFQHHFLWQLTNQFAEKEVLGHRGSIARLRGRGLLLAKRALELVIGGAEQQRRQTVQAEGVTA